MVMEQETQGLHSTRLNGPRDPVIIAAMKRAPDLPGVYDVGRAHKMSDAEEREGHS